MKGPPEVTGAELARACGVKPASVSNWLSGDSKTMEASNLLAAARRCNVGPDWLATGVGPQKAGANPFTPELQMRLATCTPAEARKLENALRLTLDMDLLQAIPQKRHA